jgi:hypothetical protein
LVRSSVERGIVIMVCCQPIILTIGPPHYPGGPRKIQHLSRKLESIPF